jgi:recombination DNA repair RAD52 pathway protein
MTTQIEPIRPKEAEAERTRAVVAVLTQRTPKEAVRYRQGPGGKTLAYVEGAWVIRQLNLAFGWDWDFEVKDRQVIPGPDGKPAEVVVLGRLTCRLPDGRVVVKEDFGSEAFKAGVQAGDVFKSAATDALKRCARALGIALDLYERQAVR